MLIPAVKFASGSDDVIEGLAIPFGGPLGGKDFHGQNFGPETDLCPEWFPQGRPTLYHHGLNGAVKTAVVARQMPDVDVREEGVWIRSELDKASAYHSRVKQLVDAGALRFSSGAMPHLVAVRKDGFIERWPWVETSLTPTAANPDAMVYAVKTAYDDMADSGTESFDDHAARVVADVGNFLARAEERVEIRAAKAGRELSGANRDWLRALLERLSGTTDLAKEIEEVLNRTDPDAASKAAALEADLLISEMRRAGLPV